MGSPLEQYILSQRPKEGDTQHFQRRVHGFATENLGPSIMGVELPPRSYPFLQSLGVSRFTTGWNGLPDPIKVELAKLQPAVDRMNPNTDFGRLAELAEEHKDKLPTEMYFKMAGIALLGQGRQGARRERAVQESGLIAVNEAGRQATFGAVRAIGDKAHPTELEGIDLSPQGVAIAKLMGTVGGIALTGSLTYSAISKATMLPHIAPMLLKVGPRVREAMLGIGTMAILDVGRPDGLPKEPASIDVSARIAHPLSKMMGGGEAADRVALFIAGGTVGGLINEALGPLTRGIQEYRVSSVLANKVLTPEHIELLRTRLNEAGIGVKSTETSRSVVAKALRNLDRVGQSEKLASIFAEDNTRTEFMLQQLYTDPDMESPTFIRRGGKVLSDISPMQVDRYAQIEKASGRVGEQITAAAIKSGDRIFIGAEHADAAEAGARRGIGSGSVETGDLEMPEDAIQGFVTTASRFVTTSTANRLGLMAAPESERAIMAGGPGREWRPSHTGFHLNDEVRLMAGVFRANPEGLSVVKNIQNALAATDLVKKMGLNVTAIRAGDDYLIMRPQVSYPVRPVGARLSKQIDNFTEYVRALNRGKPTARMSVLPDGTPVRGEYSAPEMVSRYGLKAPIVEGAEQSDIAVREHFGLVDVKVESGGKITVQLPNTITQRQADLLGRIADRAGAETEIIIHGAKPGVTKSFTNSWGMQIQDQLADMVQGASRPKIGADVMAKVRQYQQQGVFEGQAAHTQDGYPIEVLRRVKDRAGNLTVIYRDPMTGAVHRAPNETISILPTSLEGEHAPAPSFYEVMDPAERKAFATMRRAMNEGLAKPITNFSQLETFAASKGKLATALGKGSVRLHDATSGETVEFDNIKAATTFIRESGGPLPDLTPPEVEELLGYKPNFGGIGPGGPPSGFGEPMPVPDDFFDKAIETNTLGELPPGALETGILPTKYLMQNLTRRYKLPFEQVFENLNASQVGRNNFVQGWAYGRGPALPQGTMSLVDIYKMAGRPNAERQELITDFLESVADPTRAAQIKSQLRPNEIKAAEELRQWYGLGPEHPGGLFKILGIESEFLTDYAPHIRSTNGAFGNDISEIWRRTRGTPMPKAVDFFADFSRDGSLNLYEKRAFVAAARYLDVAARSRFMNTALLDAKKLLRAIPDNAVKAPLVNYLEALRGSEFSMQHAAVDASFTRLIQNLGASEKVAKDVGERLTMGLLGAGYSATMGFRGGLAIRHALKIYQTLWPLVGRFDDTFAEGIGRALTKAGRDDAIRAGAITIRQAALFSGDEVAEAIPGKVLKGMYDYGIKMYNSADVLTRSVSFNVAKLQSQRAIQEFATNLEKGMGMEEARRVLIRRSGAMTLTKTMQDEFMRRIATNPESAANLMGVQISNVTEFLYGKGNQGRWMRTVAGRFFGQYGSWPIWYINYVGRSFTNMWRGGYQKEALAFIGKLGLVNLAVFESGKALGVDLRKWTVSHSLFYTGGPAVELVMGAAELSRGASEAFLQPYTSPNARQRMSSGLRLLESAGSAYIPNMYAIRDLANIINPKTPQDRIAAILSTRPTQEMTVQQKMDLLMNPGRMSTDIDLEAQGDGQQTAAELMIQGMQMAKQGGRGGAPKPGQLPVPPQGTATAPPSIKSMKLTVPLNRVQGRPPLEPTALPPEIRRGESKPNL